MTKKKKLTLGVVTAALVGTMVIGGTLAYFSQKTEVKENVFTMGDGIVGKLTEPAWDGGKTPEEAAKDPTLGVNIAQNCSPGLVIPKNPQITNTTTGTKAADAWVAVKIKYDKATYQEIDSFAAIDWSNAWTFGTKGLDTDYTVAYYNVALPKSGITTPLFNNITIDSIAEKAQLKDFNITITGYLVQTEGFKTPQEAMKAAFPDAFK